MPAPAHPAAAEPLRVMVRRVIARPVAEVFGAWTTPEAIAQWISPGIKDIRVAAEPREGGRFRIDLTYLGAPWFLDGTFLEVARNRRLRFTWVTTECPASVNSVVTVDFRALGTRTELTVRHEGFPDEGTRSNHDAPGWQQIVEVFIAAGDAEFTPARLEQAADVVAAAKRGDSYRVEVRKLIARPAEEVFAAWITPGCLEKWICPGGPGARVTAEVRVGGRFHIDMFGAKGEIWPHDGEYLEVDPPRRLAFTWVSPGENGCAESLGSVVTIDFYDRGGQTELVLVHSGFPSVKSRDDHLLGWTEIMVQLAALAGIGFRAFGIVESMIEVRKLVKPGR